MQNKHNKTKKRKNKKYIITNFPLTSAKFKELNYYI